MSKVSVLQEQTKTDLQIETYLQQLLEGDFETLQELQPQNLTGIPLHTRMLLTYIKYYSAGFGDWLISYDYPKVRAKLYVAYLKARDLDKLHQFPDLVHLFEFLSKGMIAYSGCENAMLNTDVQTFYDRAHLAADYADQIAEILHANTNIDVIPSDFRVFLNRNMLLWRGYELVGRGYVYAMQGKSLDPEDRSHLKELLDDLRDLGVHVNSATSVLTAHIFDMNRLSEVIGTQDTSIVILNGKVVLRAIGYIDETQASRFVDALLKSRPSRDILAAKICDTVGRSLVQIHPSHLMDIFETSFGEKYFDSIKIGFSARSSKPLSIRVSDVTCDAALEFVVNRIGVVTLEMTIDLPPKSGVRITRTLEDLISPHAGQTAIMWFEPPADIKRPGIQLDLDDYTEMYLRCERWKARLVAPIDELTTALSAWEDSLQLLWDFYMQPESDQEMGAPPSGLMKQVEHTAGIIRNWQSQQREASNDSKTALLLDESLALFSPDNTLQIYSLSALATILFIYFNQQMKAASPPGKSQSHVLFRSSLDSSETQKLWDPNTGWQSIITCNQLSLCRRQDGGMLPQPITEADFAAIVHHPDYRGFVIDPRESKAGFEDWRFAFYDEISRPNLGIIRAHTTDAMYLGANRAFLWFQDDPEYLVDQNIETVRLIGNIRTLALTFNALAKAKVESLAGRLSEFIDTEQKKNLTHNQDYLSEYRTDIESLNIRAERILDVIRSCTISKYQDHGVLTARMLKAVEIDTLGMALENNLRNLSRFQNFLSDVLQQKIAKVDQRGRTVITIFGIIISILSALSAAIAIIAYFFPHH